MDEAVDKKMMDLAVSLANQSPPSSTAYSVGAVIVLDGRILATGYSREFGGNEHAEQVALSKVPTEILSSRKFQDSATLYSTMEPCGFRNSGSIPCAAHLIRLGIRRVVIGAIEPSALVKETSGLAQLRAANIHVVALEGFTGMCPMLKYLFV
jgi:pyrimidine deaminase RibD-like protein